MPARNLFSHYPLGNKSTKRSIASVNQFGGVDFSTPNFSVPTNRAINIQNFIYKNGVVQKRNGYEDFCKVDPIEYFDKFTNKFNVNGVNFNEMWKFKAEDGNWHVVAHIGNLMFEIKNIDEKDGKVSIEPINTDENYSGVNKNGETVSRPYLYKFEDYKSFAFVGANRLWFLGGNKYMCLRFKDNGTVKFDPVEDLDETFIPVTTDKITFDGAANASRTPLDMPNKLTYFRKNRLLSGGERSENTTQQTRYYEYTLDSPLILDPSQTIAQRTSEDIHKISIVIKTRRKVE